MHIDYDKIVQDFDTSGLTQKKVTASFIRKNFKDEISDLRKVLTVGNGNAGDNEETEEKPLKAEFGSKQEIINQEMLPIQSLFMGQEMTTDIWLGFVRNMIKGEYVRTMQDKRGVFLVSYDKTEVQSEAEFVAQSVGDIPEKTIVAGLKKALKEKIKNS